MAWAKFLLSNYDNGIREKLTADLNESGHRAVAERTLCASFGIDRLKWEYRTFARPLIEFHLFNDLDDIIKFDDLDLYPEADRLHKDYGPEFIEMKVGKCPDASLYREAQVKLHSFLCSFDVKDTIIIRRYQIYDIHNALLALDFGDLFDSFESECSGVIREAEQSARR